mmetsp:Transcript_32566/g.93719  ORF Transcript_32566/g.93719 Transcript_32566/m.93719 type:complete len:263 (-) Transcript_32566:163-951(-)
MGVRGGPRARSGGIPRSGARELGSGAEHWRGEHWHIRTAPHARRWEWRTHGRGADVAAGGRPVSATSDVLDRRHAGLRRGPRQRPSGLRDCADAVRPLRCWRVLALRRSWQHAIPAKQQRGCRRERYLARSGPERPHARRSGRHAVVHGGPQPGHGAALRRRGAGRGRRGPGPPVPRLQRPRQHPLAGGRGRRPSRLRRRAGRRGLERVQRHRLPRAARPLRHRRPHGAAQHRGPASGRRRGSRGVHRGAGQHWGRRGRLGC